jgi:hypothetical protein
MQRHDDSADESGPSNAEEKAMGFVWFIVVGLLAGLIMEGGGYGMLGDIVVGDAPDIAPSIHDRLHFVGHAAPPELRLRMFRRGLSTSRSPTAA